MENYIIWWIAIFVIACFIEFATQQLVSVWYAAGSLVCVFLSYFGLPFYTQLIAFIVVSGITLWIFRPYAIKRNRASIVPMNMDKIIGKRAVATEDFNEVTFEGRVLVEGMDWAAKSTNQVVYQKGDELYVNSIEGVKVLVSKEEK